MDMLISRMTWTKANWKLKAPPIKVVDNEKHIYAKRESDKRKIIQIRLNMRKHCISITLENSPKRKRLIAQVNLKKKLINYTIKFTIIIIRDT